MRKIVLFASLLLGTVPTLASAATTATTATAQATKWEYGVLYFGDNADASWKWFLSNKRVDGKDPLDLLAKLGVTNKVDTLTLARALAVLGSQGWELVSVAPEGRDTRYIFKRPTK